MGTGPGGAIIFDLARDPGAKPVSEGLMVRPASSVRAFALVVLTALQAGCATPRTEAVPSSPARQAPARRAEPASKVVPASAVTAQEGASEARSELWPAGTCGFYPYLDSVCEDRGAPRFAVVLGEFAQGQVPSRRFRRMTWAPAESAWRGLFSDRAVRVEDELARAEQAASAGRKLGLPAGYPVTLSYDDLPPLDEKRRGIAVVAGLFGERAHAERFVAARGLSAEIVELAPATIPCGEDYEACMASKVTVVEVFTEAPAYAEDELRKLETKLDSQPADPATDREAQWAAGLAALTPACKIPPGRLSLVSQAELYKLSREFAPTRCSDGRKVWVSWRATRLESIVTGGDEPQIHQVVSVECDSPRLDERPFVSAPPPMLAGAGGGCRG